MQQTRKFFVLAAAVLLIYMSYRAYGWPGLAAVTGGLLMWLLLHFNRTVMVLKRAANRPVGYVDSAVMLNAKLRPGVTLLHVVALTRSLGRRTSEEGAEPEVYLWQDNGGAMVSAEFQRGKLQHWKFERPAETDEPGGAAP